MSRQLMRRAERVESLLAAAARAFALTGFAGTSMEDIAAEAGVTRLIVYRHFDGKRELYEAVLTRTSERLVEEFAARSLRTEAGIGTLLAVGREDPAAFALMFRHAAREPEFASYADGWFERVTDAIEGWIEPLVSDRVLRHWCSRTAVRTAVESVLAWLDDGPADRDAEFEARASRAIDDLVKGFLSR